MTTSPALLASVIVINYNDARFLPGCLSSLRDQEFDKNLYEVILADNASTDDSVTIVRRDFPEVRLVRFAENYGFCAGNNRALQHSRGRYVLFLNADTIVHQRWLAELVAAAEGDETVGACQSSLIQPWIDDFRLRGSRQLPERAYYYDLGRLGFTSYKTAPISSGPIRCKHLQGGSCLIRRELVGPPLHAFEERFGAYGEDLDLALRLNVWGHRTVTVPTSLVYHLNPASERLKPGLPALKMASRVVCNRILAFYKNMTAVEFILFLPVLLVGSPLKARVFGWRPLKSLLYATGGVVATVIGFFQAVSQLRRLSEVRSSVLARRRRGGLWLLRAVLWRID